MSSGTAGGVAVLTVGLDPAYERIVADEIGAHDAPASVIGVSDAAAGRRWLAERSGRAGRLVVVAAFSEYDAWGLSALFSRLRRQDDTRPAELLLVSDVPEALLPVLITDVRGMRVIPPGSPADLRAHLEFALFEPIAASAS